VDGVPTEATFNRRTVSSWPAGHGAASLDWLIGRCKTNVSPHWRHRNSYAGMTTDYDAHRIGTFWYPRMTWDGYRVGSPSSSKAGSVRSSWRIPTRASSFANGIPMQK